jgi:hypothetical protein
MDELDAYMQNLHENIGVEKKQEIVIDADDPMDDYLEYMKKSIIKNKDCKKFHSINNLFSKNT